MYKLIFGHFHVYRKSNIAAIAAILNFGRKFVRTAPPEPKVIEIWGFSLLASAYLVYVPILIYDIQYGR